MTKASLIGVGLGAALIVAGAASPLRAEADTPAAETAQAPELVEIDYKTLYRRMMRLGMVSQVLGYTLAVDEAGKPTDCELSRKFRSPYTVKALCKDLMATTTFEPARDAQGNAVAGTYEGEVEIASFFQPSR
jgi:hypothetical protein